LGIAPQLPWWMHKNNLSMSMFYAQLSPQDSVREWLWNGRRCIVQTLAARSMESAILKVI